MRACSWRWEEGYTYKYVDTHFSEYQPKFKFIILRLVMKWSSLRTQLYPTARHQFIGGNHYFESEEN